MTDDVFLFSYRIIFMWDIQKNWSACMRTYAVKNKYIYIANSKISLLTNDEICFDSVVIAQEFN